MASAPAPAGGCRVGAVSLCCHRFSKPDWLAPHGPRTGSNAELVCPSCGTAPTPLPPAGVPRSWVPSGKTPLQTGIRDVHHQANQAGQGTDDVRRGADQTRGRHGIGRSIQLDTAASETLLITHIRDGALLLHGWRDGPIAPHPIEP